MTDPLNPQKKPLLDQDIPDLSRPENNPLLNQRVPTYLMQDGKAVEIKQAPADGGVRYGHAGGGVSAAIGARSIWDIINRQQIGKRGFNPLTTTSAKDLPSQMRLGGHFYGDDLDSYVTPGGKYRQGKGLLADSPYRPFIDKDFEIDTGRGTVWKSRPGEFDPQSHYNLIQEGPKREKKRLVDLAVQQRQNFRNKYPNADQAKELGYTLDEFEAYADAYWYKNWEKRMRELGWDDDEIEAALKSVELRSGHGDDFVRGPQKEIQGIIKTEERDIQILEDDLKMRKDIKQAEVEDLTEQMTGHRAQETKDIIEAKEVDALNESLRAFPERTGITDKEATDILQGLEDYKNDRLADGQLRQQFDEVGEGWLNPDTGGHPLEDALNETYGEGLDESLGLQGPERGDLLGGDDYTDDVLEGTIHDTSERPRSVYPEPTNDDIVKRLLNDGFDADPITPEEFKKRYGFSVEEAADAVHRKSLFDKNNPTRSMGGGATSRTTAPEDTDLFKFKPKEHRTMTPEEFDEATGRGKLRGMKVDPNSPSEIERLAKPKRVKALDDKINAAADAAQAGVLPGEMPRKPGIRDYVSGMYDKAWGNVPSENPFVKLRKGKNALNNQIKNVAKGKKKQLLKYSAKKFLTGLTAILPYIDAPLEALMFSWYVDDLPKEDQARLHNWYTTELKPSSGITPQGRAYSGLREKGKEAGVGIFNYLTSGIFPPVKYEHGKPSSPWDPVELREAHPAYAIGLEIGLRPGDPNYSLRTKPYPLGKAVAEERARGGGLLGREANIPKSIRDSDEYQGSFGQSSAWFPKY